MFDTEDGRPARGRQGRRRARQLARPQPPWHCTSEAAPTMASSRANGSNVALDAKGAICGVEAHLRYASSSAYTGTRRKTWGTQAGECDAARRARSAAYAGERRARLAERRVKDEVAVDGCLVQNEVQCHQYEVELHVFVGELPALGLTQHARASSTLVFPSRSPARRARDARIS
jgi:hypothetical protein